MFGQLFCNILSPKSAQHVLWRLETWGVLYRERDNGGIVKGGVGF